MSTSSPDLKLVASSGTEGSTPGGASAGAESRDRGSVPVWLLAVFVFLSIVLGIAYLSKRSEVAGLKAEAAALHAELERTSRVLSAYEGRIGQIRSGVHALVDQAASLQALVDVDPLLNLDAPFDGAEPPVLDEAATPQR